MKSARYSSRSPSTPACPPRSTASASRAKRSPKWARPRSAMAVGFIGLGNMGFPLARRLIQGDHDVIAFDTRGAALQRPEPGGASPPSPAASMEVATGAAGVIEGSRVKRYVDLSTVGRQTAVRIHDLLAERNIVAIDSPVSGGVRGAENGSLAVMVSGPRTEFEVVRT